MIVDSSALVAILQGEPRSDRLFERVVSADCRMSAATLVEVGIVADSRSASLGVRLDDLIATLEVTIEPVTIQHAAVARQAYRRFGRGSGSPARLNFGDCFAYALSVVSGEPLLYVGDDFSHTDVASAI